MLIVCIRAAVSTIEMSALFSVLFSFSAICFVRLQDIPKNTVFLSTNIVGKPNRGDCKATWELKNSNSAMRHDSTVALTTVKLWPNTASYMTLRSCLEIIIVSVTVPLLRSYGAWIASLYSACRLVHKSTCFERLSCENEREAPNWYEPTKKRL